MIINDTPLAQLLTVTATDGLELPALLYQPEKPTKRLAIWLHGMGTGGSFYPVRRTNAIAKALASQGIAFLALNNRGAHLAQQVKFLDDDGEYQKRTVGTSHELIADCVLDVDGALKFAKDLGYDTFYLAGHSTGANKICVYNHYKPKNPFAAYVIFGGGDDTGIFCTQLGEARFHDLLKQCRERIQAGHGEDLVPTSFEVGIFSYQSLHDLMDPDGDYNTFPYTENHMGIKLSTKPLFRYFKSITKPSLVIYGADDPYCPPDAATAIKALQKYTPGAKNFTYQLIPGADHGCLGKEARLGEAMAGWLSRLSSPTSSK